MAVLKIIVGLYMIYIVCCKDKIPEFSSGDSNVTVVVGREGSLLCTIENLQNYKVAWLREDTQTLLTVGPSVITKNHRVGLARLTPQTWALTIRDVRPTDAGQYMCQVNTEPMITRTYQLHVTVPPDIEDTGSSSEALVREGDNATLHCAATGTPPPAVTWRREDSAPIAIGGKSVSKWSGAWLNLTTVGREMGGAFFCIASNGVPPSVSKRILLRVLSKPSVRLTYKMIGGYLEESVGLQCKVEAYPNPAVYWTHMDGNRLPNSSKYLVSMKSEGYKHEVTLRVSKVSRDDIGEYHCHAENALGAASDVITLYTLATTTTNAPTSQETTILETKATTGQPELDIDLDELGDNKTIFTEDNYVVVLGQHQMQNLDVGSTS